MAKNHAQILSSMKSALEEIKIETIGDEPKKVGISRILEANGVNSYMLAVLKDMDILKFSKADNSKATLYQWNLGSSPIDEKLLNKIHEGVKIKHAAPKQARAALNANSDKYAVLPPETKQSNRPKTYRKRDRQNPILAETIQSEELKVTPKVSAIVNRAEEKQTFAPELGVIFGYKQLQYLSGETFSLPHDVILHGLILPNSRMVLTKVRAIRYRIENSDLEISFYNDSDQAVIDDIPEESLILTLNVKNTVVGLKRGGGDSKMLILHLTLVPVKDPFQVR